MCRKWQENSLHFNVYRHFCKLDKGGSHIAKCRRCRLNEIAKIKVSISLPACSLLTPADETIGSGPVHSQPPYLHVKKIKLFMTNKTGRAVTTAANW